MSYYPYPFYYYLPLFPLVGLIVHTLYGRLSLFRRERRFARSNGCKPIPKAPQWDPVLGLDHFVQLGKAAVGRRYLEHIQRMFGRYGNTFAITLMGQRLVFTNEPRNIHAVLVTRFPDFDIGQRRRDNSADLLGVGVFNADGPTWEHARATVRPNFTRAQVSDLQLFEKHVGVWMAGLPKTATELVDMQEWSFRFTLDVGTEFLFDKSTGVLDREATDLGRRFAWAFNQGVDGVAQRIRLGRLAPFYRNSDYVKACKMVHEYVDPIIVAALERTRESKDKGAETAADERYTFLSALTKEGLPPKKIRDHMLNILIAARDTSACLMSAAFFELARRQDIQAKLRAEVENQLEGRLPGYDDIKELTYLSWFIKETLRLYPPIPLNIRVANKDTVLPVGGGADGTEPIFVPKDQEIVYQIFSTHRRPDLWGEDADLFRPERWRDVRTQNFQYVPFNAGPRICPGQQFALLETSYVLVRFLQEYSRIEAPSGKSDPWTENYTLTCSVGQGSWVRLTKRETKQEQVQSNQ